MSMFADERLTLHPVLFIFFAVAYYIAGLPALIAGVLFALLASATSASLKLKRVSKLLSAAMGAASGVLAAYLAFRFPLLAQTNPQAMAEYVAVGGVAGTACGVLVAWGFPIGRR